MSLIRSTFTCMVLLSFLALPGCGGTGVGEDTTEDGDGTTETGGDTTDSSDTSDTDNETDTDGSSNANETTTAWRFAVVGDTHIPEANLLSEMVPQMMSDGIKLVLVPGDIVDSGTGTSSSELAGQLSEWKAVMAPLYNAGIGVYPIRGNHEDDANRSVETWNEAFTGTYALPSNGPAGETNLTYSFTYNNALFIGLDEYVNIHRVNQTWLDAQLAANTTQPHIFVFGHEPAFKAFHTDCLDDYVIARDSFWNSLTAAGAKIYLSGHDHFFDMARVDDGDGDEDDDLYQIIVGSGGGSLFDHYRYVGDNSSFTPTGITHSMENGYLLVEMSGDSGTDLDVTLTFKRRTVAANGAVSYDPTYSFRYTAASKLKYPVIDTGQTTFYDNQNTIDAPASGEAFYGQDAHYTGLAPAYRDNGDGTVTDLNTGLMWVKARGNKMTWSLAASSAQDSRVGGYDDWRMPTAKELYSLIKFTGAQGPSMTSTEGYIPFIDTDFFEFVYGAGTSTDRVIDSQDWSSTLYTGTVMSGQSAAFGVNFADGRIKGYPTATGEHYVRYVRGNPLYGQNAFIDNKNGTVTDTATQLMWTQSDSGVGMAWQTALEWAQEKNAEKYLGYNDWRVPNAKELHTLLDYSLAPRAIDTSRQGPAIDPLFLSTSLVDEGGGIDYPFYWTSTSFKDGTPDSVPAAYISFGSALGYMKWQGNAYYELLDVHGAGAQRSDPKAGNVSDYLIGVDASGAPVHGRGPQGDVVRIENFVRLVRGLE